MQEEEKKEYRRILDHFGFGHQLMKLAEECVELADAAFKLRKDQVSDEHHGAGKGAWRNLAEEAADVMVLLSQMGIYAESSPDGKKELPLGFWETVEHMKKDKFNRVLDMIDTAEESKVTRLQRGANWIREKLIEEMKASDRFLDVAFGDWFLWDDGMKLRISYTLLDRHEQYISDTIAIRDTGHSFIYPESKDKVYEAKYINEMIHMIVRQICYGR